MIIDAHVHLWQEQRGRVDGRPVVSLGNGRSDFGGVLRQMQPPDILDGTNPAERLLSNMDYARVNGAVVTQEYIDGNQDAYLRKVRKQYPDRLRVCSLYEEKPDFAYAGFDGIKICASRLSRPLESTFSVFETAQKMGMFISIDLADGDKQTAAMREIIRACPDLRIAIGHFGMVTRDGWEKQIELAGSKNVYIESGGLTWLFNREFYPYPSAIAAILRAKEICSMQKLMWGSDYPRTMTAITYRMALRFITDSSALTPEDKQLFLGGNAERFYGFAHQEPLAAIYNMVD